MPSRPYQLCLAGNCCYKKIPNQTLKIGKQTAKANTQPRGLIDIYNLYNLCDRFLSILKVLFSLSIPFLFYTGLAAKPVIRSVKQNVCSNEL